VGHFDILSQLGVVARGLKPMRSRSHVDEHETRSRGIADGLRGNAMA